MSKVYEAVESVDNESTLRKITRLLSDEAGQAGRFILGWEDEEGEDDVEFDDDDDDVDFDDDEDDDMYEDDDDEDFDDDDDEDEDFDDIEEDD